MSGLALLEQVADDLFREHCPPDVVTAAETDGWATALWDHLAEAGFTRVGVPEAAGGDGGGWPEAAAILRAAGRYAAPLPLAENGIILGRLLAATGPPLPAGPLAVALTRDQSAVSGVRVAGGWRLDGWVDRVAWARRSGHIATTFVEEAGQRFVAIVPTAGIRIAHGSNLAGEPRDRVEFAAVHVRADHIAPAASGQSIAGVLADAALARAVQMSGALERALALTVEYARVREQFGRPIGSFQTIQQDLARLAGEVHAAVAMTEHAVDAVAECAADAVAAVAAARVRSGLAAGRGAAVAHQIHGAIGFTDEHQLRHFTRRLWSWRDEYGTERAWAERLGRRATADGPDGLWQLVTG